MKHIFVLMFCCLFIACSSDGSKSSFRQLPDASGRIDEVLVVMDAELWEDTTLNSIGSTVRDLLQQEFPGLPQPEPYFTLSYIDPVKMVPLLQRASNMIYIGTTTGQGLGSRTIQEYIKNLSPETRQKAEYMFSAKDVWAKPQQVTFVYADTREGLLNVLLNNEENIIKRLQKPENAKALRNAYASQVNHDLTNTLKEEFKLDLKIPNSFRFVKKTEDLFWVRQDIEGEVSNMMIRVIPFTNDSMYSGKYAIIARDEVGKYFFTDTPGSHMITDLRFEPIQETVKIDGDLAIESRGLWRMSKDFMGGPYVNYCFKDKKNNRIIILDGNVYAPQWKKRRPIRKLENLLKSVKMF